MVQSQGTGKDRDRHRDRRHSRQTLGRPAPASWEPVIDRMLGEAVQQADWQHLKGKGQRLNLDPPPGTPSDMVLANKLMADNDVTPAWIEDRKRLLARIQAWRDSMAAWQARHEAGPVSAENIRHQRALWQRDIQALNRAIADLNIAIPIWHMEVLKLDLERELARAGAPPQD